jgi:hypothetical protein
MAATLLLAIAAVTTTWCGYQATRWNGEQSKTAASASATRFAAARSSDLANAQTEIDVATFTQWVDAYAQGQHDLADFYLLRFRDEFRPAVEAWIASRPLKSPDAPLTPFAMPQYKLAATTKAQTLDAQAESLSADVRTDIQRASNYVLGVVLCSVVLFFAGISTKLISPKLRVATLVVGGLVFLVTLGWVLTLPVSVSV